jgi:glycine/D-amino acid oxidase-like deaminating enzyme
VQKNTTEKYDILIVGAGLMGSSTAMHLGKFLSEKGDRILACDADLEGKLSSSELNAGGARATWDQPVNVALARTSIDFMRERQEETGFHAVGYLWMFRPDAWDKARARAEWLNKEGLSVEALSVSDLRSRVPFIDKTDDLAGATFSPKDGLFNPNLLKGIFRKEARAAGVEFRDGMRIERVEKSTNSDSWIVFFREASPEERELRIFLEGKSNLSSGELRKIEVKKIINCAGAWAGNLAKLIGYESPVWAVRRQVSIFSCREVDMRSYGMMVDPSGVYFHPEADQILGGWADPNEPRGFNLNYDGQSFFEEKIWLPLYERSSKFEGLKHITGWGGLYEMTPDSNAVIGSAPGVTGVYECHGFSGRGAMQSFAAGRGIAELLAFGRYQTIDLSVLDGRRFRDGKLVPEGLHI